VVERRATASAAFGVIALAAIVAPSACKTPTEVTVEIAADIAYRADMTVAVQIDRADRVELATPRIVTRSAWSAGAALGTVVVLPSGDDEQVVMRVVLAVGREPATCSAAEPVGCIVVRRRIRFVAGESTRARVVLRPVCLGTFCDVGASCAVDGTCGSLESDAAQGDGGVPLPPVADAGDPYADAVLADRPRHYYRLDDLPGATLARDTMGRADGTFAGVKLGVTGAIRTSNNSGAFFDGSSSVSIPSVEDLPGAFSIEAWARADDAKEPRPTIVERVDPVGASLFGYRMSKPPGTVGAFEVFRGVQSFTADVRANKFAGYSHLVAVVRGGELEMWLDGTRAATTVLDAASSSAVIGPLVIGGSRTGASAFKGAIDEVAVYDYPLDREQIARHYAVAEGEP
jgi:hypothetical protein